jgi:hypothetical protein
MKSPAAAFLRVATVCLLASRFSACGQIIYHWYNIGPQPINLLDTNNNVIEQDIGRVAALAVDPSNSNHWLIGTAQGGVWETRDRGSTWDPRTDDQASLATGALAFAPGTPLRVYAGTGEANFRGDDYAGAGLLLSDNGGATWHMLNTNFARTSFSRIHVHPANSNHLTVATARGGGGVGEESSGHGNVPGAPPRGVFVSTDGGTNFTQVLTGEATALEANPNNFDEQYAGLGEIYGDPTNGVYRTTNGWQTVQWMQGPWIQTNFTYTNFPIETNLTCNITNCYTNIIYTNIITGTNVFTGGRITMAGSPSDPNVLYVGVADVRFRYLGDLRGIWVTTNAWADNPTWDLLPYPPVFMDGVSLPRFWYMFDLLVDPADPATVYLAEFSVWRYQSGTWTNLAIWSKTDVHPDHHAMAWVPGAGQSVRMLLGNDGGVYLSDPGVSGASESWSNLNAGLRITQFYKGAVATSGDNLLIMGGAQDNFTSLFGYTFLNNSDMAWWNIGPGDGGDCAILPTDPLNQWALSSETVTDDYYGGPNTNGILRIKDGNPNDSHSAALDITDVLPFSQQFYVHFEKAPYNHDLFIAGTARLWRCNNFFSGTIPSWFTNSPTMLDTNGAPVPISAMAFAPSDTNGMIYALGTEDGQLWITSNGGGMWKNLDPTNGVPDRYVSGLAFSPTNAGTLYVTLSGFDEGTPAQPGHLFKTSNALAATPLWTNTSPPVNLPMNCVAIDPLKPGNIFVGADIGVWNSTDGGGSWTHYGPAAGMPNVAVYDLRFNASLLTAFTHGRGAYLFSKINIPILVFAGPKFHPTPNCLTCPPDQLWINPGDEVSVEIPLQNVLPIDTLDLQATLLPSVDIAPITGMQHYGVVKGQGKAVSRVFKFIAGAHGAGPFDSGGSCGGTAQAVFQLQDAGGVDLGQVTVPFRLGVPSHPLVEDFEEGLPSGLPPGWTSVAAGVDLPWTTSTNPPPNLPEGGEDEFEEPADNTSVFVSDAIGVGQSYLTSPPFAVATAQAQLYFRQAFAVSNAFDGCILQIAIGGQPFQEIVQAGGSFVMDGYNKVLSDFNPLGPRPAWSGNSGGWLPVLVNLPPAAAEHTVQLRWLFATSRGITNGGCFVDSVIVTEPLCLPPVGNPVILNPALNGDFFTFTINTVSNRNYIIQYTTNLANVVWQTFEIRAGNGSPQVISVPIHPDRQRFCRFVVQ